MTNFEYVVFIIVLIFFRAMVDVVTGYEEKGTLTARLSHNILLQASGVLIFLLLVQLIQGG
jgi:hypothetical protein